MSIPKNKLEDRTSGSAGLVGLPDGRGLANGHCEVFPALQGLARVEDQASADII